MMRPISKPAAGEYAPYTSDYIDRVPDDGQVLAHLEANLDVMQASVARLNDVALSTPFAAGEWTVKEILMHIVDTERILSTRALRIARNDLTPLPGFEQDDYVPNSHANARALDSIMGEYSAVRAATLSLFDSLDDAALLRVGTASGNNLSVRAAAFFIAGHELHHLESIRENYL